MDGTVHQNMGPSFSALLPLRQALSLPSQPPTHLTQVQDEAVPGVEAVPAQCPLGGTDVLLPLNLVELLGGCWGGPRGCLMEC